MDNNTETLYEFITLVSIITMILLGSILTIRLYIESKFVHIFPLSLITTGIAILIAKYDLLLPHSIKILNQYIERESILEIIVIISVTTLIISALHYFIKKPDVKRVTKKQNERTSFIENFGTQNEDSIN